MVDNIAWISTHILPCEADVRRWLRRSSIGRANEDDIIQEAYCRMANIADHTHILSARSYFFSTARNVMLDGARRNDIVRIDGVAEIDALHVLDEEPSAERILDGRQRLEHARQIIEQLPPRCREVFVLRKVEQLSQRETAERLGVTENVVEKEVARGLKMLMLGMAEREADGTAGADQL